MAHSARYRPMSPGGKRFVDPMRASTGTVPLSSSYDPYDPSASRYGYDGYRSDVPYVTGYAPRLSVEPKLEAQQISSKAYRDPGHSTKLRTEYAIRPRPRSHTASDAHQSPLRLAIPSSPLSRQSPIITSSHGRTPSPLPPRSAREDAERYLVPASSGRGRHPHRVYSTDYASDTGRLDHRDKTARARMGHPGYRAYGPSSHWRYPPPSGLRNGEDIDDYDAYSYTNAREQFEKDSAARVYYRRPGPRKERPVSMTGLEDYSQMVPKRESRALGPPPSQRGLEKLERDERSRRHGESTGSQRQSWQRAPVLHQGGERDDGYSSYREEYDDGRRRRRHRRHEDDSSRQHRDERVSSKYTPGHPTVTGAAAGLGTAVLASGYSDEVLDYDQPARRSRHRSRDPERDESRNRKYLEPDHRSHRSRSRRTSRRRHESDSDGYTSDEDLRKYRREPSAHRKASDSESSTSSRGMSSRHLKPETAHRRRSSRSRHREDSIPRKDASQGFSGSQEDLKKPITVDPAPAKEPDAPPKGILKPPREKFPEEPNPVREGVAPLKDAHKKGIPPGARWTKIDRRLVNPAALEAGHERFEERSDHVIVLRVLTKEEIQAYAVKTQEIRDARYQEYLTDRRKHREERRRLGRREDDSSSDDEDEEDTPLAIEAPLLPDKLPFPKNDPRASSHPGREPARAY